MTNQTRREYIEVMKKRYRLTKVRKEKKALITEVVLNLGIHRKSAIRLLKRKKVRYIKKKRGKQVIYKDHLIKPLSIIWKAAGSPCSKRLRPQIREIMERLVHWKELKLYGTQEALLCRMGVSTIDRLLEGERDYSQKEYGLSGTKKSPLLKTLIPVRTCFTDEERYEPGHTELDCVLHCGSSLTGIYAETLNILDIATHWNEKSIFLQKTKVKIIGRFHDLSKQFPYPILSIDFDNGYEFVNWMLKGYCEKHGIAFSRSRSYQKNDQAHIEGKNYHSVRKVTGYDRIDDEYLVTLIDNVYQNEHRLLTNFFYTTMKLKTRTKEAGKVTKTYEEAQTPYQRVLASATIAEEKKRELRAIYQTLNPAELQRRLRTKLQKIYTLMRQKQIISSVTVSYQATPLPLSFFGNT